MKIIYTNFKDGLENHQGAGEIKLQPVDQEDMWHLYNVIAVGDHVKAKTIRKVQMSSATGSANSQTKKFVMVVEVERIAYDSDACELHLSGRNQSELEFCSKGSYHTLKLEKNRPFTLIKDNWDSVSRERILLATDVNQRADVAAVLLQEGLAHIFLVTDSMTMHKCKITEYIPKKRKYHCDSHDKALQRFYETILTTLLRSIRLDVVKAVIVASPGFVKDGFQAYLWRRGAQDDMKIVMENKSKFLFVHSTSGHKHSLKELLSDPTVISRLQDTKASMEVRALHDFHTMLGQEPDRATYGHRSVLYAVNLDAVETLLIHDCLFRSRDVQERRKWVNCVDAVRAARGEVRIFSSLHESGEQLKDMGEVAAVLRFPIPDLEEIEEDEESSAEPVADLVGQMVVRGNDEALEEIVVDDDGEADTVDQTDATVSPQPDASENGHEVALSGYAEPQTSTASTKASGKKKKKSKPKKAYQPAYGDDYDDDDQFDHYDQYDFHM